ncbi:MAG: S41 family peptidase [Acidobacteriaceae bacterium]
MFRRLVMFALVSAISAFAQTGIPTTPAGTVLSAWLAAFNSGDHAKLAAYSKTYDPKHPDDFATSEGFQQQTGGFDLLGIDDSEPRSITFRVKEKNSPTVAVGHIQVTDSQPVTVERFSMNAIPPGTTVEDVKLDAAERQRVIDGAIALLKEYYIDPPIAQKMADAVQERDKKGEYGSFTDGGAFAAQLTDDFQAVSHDRHLHVNYAPYKLPPDHEGPPSPEDQARFRKDMQRHNCGFEKVEIFSGNIGYVKFNMFAPANVCGDTVAHAMGFVAHSDAVIFDLRDNGGGDPHMVSLVASYLFDQPTHLNDLYDRKKDETTQYWTASYLSGDRMAKQPIYVLTSKRTFSGGEEFCYDLKTQKRATLVGETTGGGAHPVAGHRIDDHFRIGVPFAHPINPITKLDWEGTGVTPDVAVSAADALDTAKKLAAAKIHESPAPSANSTAPGK